MYHLEIEHVIKSIRESGAKKILLQLPDGFRSMAFRIAETIMERSGSEVFISGYSCYGACDMSIGQFKDLDIDLIVHYGHGRMLPDTIIPTLYIVGRVDFDVYKLAEMSLPEMRGWKRVGLTATIQHAHLLDKFAKVLRDMNIKTAIGESQGKNLEKGQILGCDFSTCLSIAEIVEGYLFVGAGRFHPLGLALSTGKQVVVANPFTFSVSTVRQQELLHLAKKRMAAVKKASDATRFGIIVSLKPGQFNLSAAIRLRDKFIKCGKNASVIFLDEVSFGTLGNFTEVEAFVNTACPRISLDGLADIRIPVLNVKEAQVILNEKEWGDIWGSEYFIA